MMGHLFYARLGGKSGCEGDGRQKARGSVSG